MGEIIRVKLWLIACATLLRVCQSQTWDVETVGGELAHAPYASERQTSLQS
jgi:hypothetical protein